jgi:RNA polymerase sigma-70 factor (ECF subfamily)
MGQRDREVFSVLVREHMDMLLTYVRSMVRDAATVEDIFQETMLVAWRRFDDYDQNRPLAHWLRGIARKLVIAHYRRLRRRPFYSEAAILEAIDERMAQIDSQRGDTWSDKVAALAQCLDLLPEPLRRSIKLFYEDACNTEVIAIQTNTTREAAKKRLQTARSLLAECLRRKGLFPRLPEVSP